MADPGLLSLSVHASLRDAIQVMERGASQIVLVVDVVGRLLGIVTDGDVRRGLLSGEHLDTPIASVMTRDFSHLPVGASPSEALAMMRRLFIHQVPVLTPDGRVADLYLLDELMQPQRLPNWVVVMAGGQGRRLLPLTRTVPKPMLPVAGRPMLEIIIEGCRDAGLFSVFIAVNHLKTQIMDHFGDGRRHGVQIEYLQEQSELGTAGALSLLPHLPADPLLVMNGDVLTRVDFRQLVRFHEEHSARATICVREHSTEIPFGVVTTEGATVRSIDEKPVVRHHVNAGIYVLDPSVLGEVPRDKRVDMPDLLMSLGGSGAVTAFPVHEYWLDAGHPAALEQANTDWRTND